MVTPMAITIRNNLSHSTLTIKMAENKMVIHSNVMDITFVFNGMALYS